MLNTPFTPWPSYSEEEADRIKRILLSNKVNYWTGDECRLFEKEFAEWAGTKYAVSLANGTVALELALHALNIQSGDEVIVTPRTFIASASSIVLSGAIPVFVDVDRDSQNITAETIAPKITSKTKAIICVHLAGWPCEMDEIMELAELNNIYVIEDCAQAHGAKYKGKNVGSIGHIGAWSFCQDKIMTTGGEGGMITTNDSAFWSRIWSFKDHGKSWEAVFEREHAPGFRWLHESFGTNLRMLEIQAAIGRIQLGKMTDWHSTRVRNAEMIWQASQNTGGLRVPVIPDYIEHAAYKCYVFVRKNSIKQGWSRDRIMNAIIQMGVPAYTGSCSEVYLEKAFDKTGFQPKEHLAVAKELGDTSLMFLVHPTLGSLEIDQTCQAIRRVMKLAAK